MLKLIIIDDEEDARYLLRKALEENFKETIQIVGEADGYKKGVALLESIPSVKAAMFTELPSGSYLGKHRDPYAGSVRYHLGLVTPNSDDCFIEVDQERYSWRVG